MLSERGEINRAGGEAGCPEDILGICHYFVHHKMKKKN